MSNETVVPETNPERHVRPLITVALAVQFVIKNLGQLLAMIVQAAVLGVATAVFIDLITQSDMPEGPVILILGIAFAPISVAIHRAVVLHEPLSASKYVSSFLHARVWKFVGCGILMFVLLVIAVSIPLLGMDFENPSSLPYLIPGLAMLCMMALYLRFAFIFPAIATDQRRPFKDARERMRGNGWRVFGALLLVGLPGGMLRFITFDNVAILIIVILLSVLWIPLMPSVLSFAYRKTSS